MSSTQMEIRKAIAARAGALVREGYHCSEAIVLAVAPHVVRRWHPAYTRIATGFSEGVGDTRQELCGALAGGVMIISALFGRATLEDDTLVQRLVREYRERFIEIFGETQCAYLQENVVDAPGGLGSCAVLVERAAMALLGVLGAAGIQLQATPAPDEDTPEPDEA